MKANMVLPGVADHPSDVANLDKEPVSVGHDGQLSGRDFSPL
jgi:hypothetical protein